MSSFEMLMKLVNSLEANNRAKKEKKKPLEDSEETNLQGTLLLFFK